MAKWRFETPDTTPGLKLFGEAHRDLSDAYRAKQTKPSKDRRTAMFRVLEGKKQNGTNNPGKPKAKDANNKFVKEATHDIVFLPGGEEDTLSVIKPKGGFPDPRYLKRFVEYCQTAAPMKDKVRALHGMMLLSKCR